MQKFLYLKMNNYKEWIIAKSALKRWTRKRLALESGVKLSTILAAVSKSKKRVCQEYNLLKIIRALDASDYEVNWLLTSRKNIYVDCYDRIQIALKNKRQLQDSEE